MKLVTFETGGKTCAGYLDGEEVVVCAEGIGADQAVLGLASQGAAGLRDWAMGGGRRIASSEVRLRAPIPEPRRDIFCVGKNYYAHAAEFHGSGFDSTGKAAVPEVPIIFTKATTSVVGPGDAVDSSLDPTASVDYEGELGVVIGKGGRGIAAADAFDHVFGYVILNDVTSRELQRRHNQWIIGKGIDTFCPMGPWLVTADEVADVRAMTLETRVNGQTRQKASVADLIFDIPTLIETLSATMTLLPGDIIATGTPEGVGIGFTPPRFLAAGDRMVVTITGLGELENPVI
ncbi:fumarylacetoacetate hydrolase family protein [Solirhodobacter olei]|uniref:fumarylacetoacetate hydrolase family protein n=1 Tax=Solirhodobacter olei TaxID=2493082 RepID=UPI000FD93B71|nr:fumarylacetoacetate hydrolase family protein [Solirhodobacter olei]